MIIFMLTYYNLEINIISTYIYEKIFNRIGWLYLNKIKIITLIITVFCFVGIITTSALIINWNKDVNTNNEIQKRIEKFIESDEQSNININFNELRKINSDTIGYIEVANTNIKYVVVQGKDNSYYLSHNFEKKKNIAGWIFMDYKNKADGTDKNLVIYGHDTSDGTMFGSLSNLLEEKRIKNKDNLIINFVTDQGLKKYKIFSIYTIKPEEYYITTKFNEDEFVKFKKKIKERSKFKIETDLDNKNIITLSTCQNHGLERIAVHAVEI